MNIGDRITLPPEPPVGTRLGIEEVDRETESVKALDLVHTKDGWFYLGHLTEDGKPHSDKWGDPILGWTWNYVISTHTSLIVIEVP